MVTPEQCNEDAKNIQLAVLELLIENQIDDTLKAGKRAFLYPDNVPSALRKKLNKKYTDGGWYVSEPFRDGGQQIMFSKGSKNG